MTEETHNTTDDTSACLRRLLNRRIHSIPIFNSVSYQIPSSDSVRMDLSGKGELMADQLSLMAMFQGRSDSNTSPLLRLNLSSIELLMIALLYVYSQWKQPQQVVLEDLEHCLLHGVDDLWISHTKL